MKNPLLHDFATLHGTPPFAGIGLEHYMPAFEEGIARLRNEVNAITDNTQTPTFENTVEALEQSGALLHGIESIFFALNHADTSDEMEAVANEVQPMLTEVANDISLNAALFGRVRAVWEARDAREYTPEQAMLLEKTYRGFVRSGTGLDETGKERYRALTTELGQLSLLFAQRVRAATNAYGLHIAPTDEARIADLPADLRRSMAEEAARRGADGWMATLQPADFEAFMMHSADRELKEKLWRARLTLCYADGAEDNREAVRRIASLRVELARLLGYATWADYTLEESMAGSTTVVEGFIDELLVSTKTHAEEELREIGRFAAVHGGAEVRQWDIPYYIEKYRAAHYNVSDEEIRRYVGLDDAERGVFELAERLFGISLRRSESIEVYHPDVRAFEVFDADGSLLAVLYMDYYARPSKQGGAWMTEFRPMFFTADGREVRPLVSCCFNFGKPSGGSQARLSFRELETLLHEFGHALHGIFARGRYASLTGTSVYRDFVELPSQILENWATEREFLDMWARSVAGEQIPSELVANIRRSKKFMAAYQNVVQLSYGMLDMAWHTLSAPVSDDIDPGAFETAATVPTAILPRVGGVCMSTSFAHIFAGGYAAGYYGYKWAEVLDADAFSLFEQRGIFDRVTARSFRDNMLAPGGSEPPMVLYERFRGRPPSVEALIRKMS
ncbi:MAG: M3 family metallopeptidase [Rikenellaceae bacterium]|nr:M3 family metallopeptidase [Rikenellaceae bacterium]MCL2692568.1 M3 family metallopeptidase [Rikenellaceae bacterium]